VSVNEKKWLVMHVHVQLSLVELGAVLQLSFVTKNRLHTQPCAQPQQLCMQLYQGYTEYAVTPFSGVLPSENMLQRSERMPAYPGLLQQCTAPTLFARELTAHVPTGKLLWLYWLPK
jgi:hypothetical protein